MRIFLHFGPETSAVHRARLEYAFRLFCAIYGHEPCLALEARQGADVTLTYAPLESAQPVVRLSTGYKVRSLNVAAPAPSPFERDAETTVLFYKPVSGCEPDWLGEIFEWVSCADEYSVTNFDSVGRVPFSASYIGRHNLDAKQPYAAIAMRFLQLAIAKAMSIEAPLPRPPLPSPCHMVANTHDVDFLPVGRLKSVQRLMKNAAISLLLYKSFKAAATHAGYAGRLAFGGPDVLDQVATLADRERALKVTASYYLLCRRAHRRDGNYSIRSAAVRDLIRSLQDTMEVGVHGSYCSLDEPDGLAKEFELLRELGVSPLGGRQHWLRFTIPQLIRGVQLAGAAYDTSLGWSDYAGFRAGACFAFPPYDFDREAPAGFLEVPLVIMDRNSVEMCGGNGDRSTVASEVLRASRRYGWGGISVLWHPAIMGGGQYPCEAGELFWSLLEEGLREKDTWCSTASLVRTIWQRYADAGLLPPRKVNYHAAWCDDRSAPRLENTRLESQTEAVPV